jgi:hypothetical protein
MKRFLLTFLRNLAILAVCLFGMYLYLPEVFGQVYQFMGALLGPGLIILIIIVTALPQGRRS